jgi:hypothetical protein
MAYSYDKNSYDKNWYDKNWLAETEKTFNEVQKSLSQYNANKQIDIDKYQSILNDDYKKSKKQHEEMILDERATIEAEIKRAKELDALLNIELMKLDLKEGDTLILKLTTNPNSDSLRTLVSQLRKLSIITANKINIFIVPKDATIEGLDEKEMNENGWYRRGDARRLLRPYEV